MAELSITRSPPEGGHSPSGTFRAWSITINNPTAADLESWKHAKMLHWVKDVIGQLERGECGTLHIQGILKTDKVRFAQVKKAFPRAHIEVARNEIALTNYCGKEETRVASIVAAKVATASDIQSELLNRVMIWLEDHYPGKSLHDREVEMMITKHWETFLDSAVNVLICKGYYGAEFSVCNPQIRSAYRRYMYSMLKRQMDAEEKENKNDLD